MENWRIALINETRRRQEQIAEAEIDRMIQQAGGAPSGGQRISQKFILQFAGWMVAAGTRLQRHYSQLATQPATGAEASPCS